MVTRVHDFVLKEVSRLVSIIILKNISRNESAYERINTIEKEIHYFRVKVEFREQEIFCIYSIIKI